jgi:protein-disulfide isomerase
MSTNEPKQTKAEKQEAARAARKQAEQAESAAAAKKRRLWQLGGIAGIAVAAIVAVVVVTSSGSSNSDLSGKPNGAADIQKLFAGLPQSGNSVGKPNAPLTMVEFADLKCPVCRGFDVTTLPTLINKYVRTGKMRFEIRLLHFVGEQDNPGDSENAARFAMAAGKQNREVQFVELFYFNQKDETTRYATDPYLTWLGNAVPGLNSQQALAQRNDKAITAKLAAYSQQFAANGFTGTPSFLLGTTGGSLQPLVAAGDLTSPSSFTSQIDAALKQ